MTTAQSTSAQSSDPSEIVQGLYVGNETCARLHGGAFDLIVNCTPHLPFPEGVVAGIRVAVHDDPFDSLSLFQILRDDRVLERMRETVLAGGRVLVHCQAGAQRSPAVAACYLVAVHGLSVDGALAHVRSRRPVAFWFQANLRRAVDLMHAYCRSRCAVNHAHELHYPTYSM
jgi:atypical dual specificity phosphatase